MLADVKFDLDRMNSDSERCGVYYTKTVEPSDTGTDHPVITIIGSADPEHEWWKSSDLSSSTTVSHTIQEELGIFYTNSFNFNHEFSDTNFKIVDDYPTFSDDGSVLSDDEWGGLSSYGIADNVEQVKARFANVIANPDTLVCISMTPVFKKAQPEHGGWRWHKWGSYIGVQNPQREYLYDEPEIDMVLIFHVYVVKEV